jgi:hypothetical protein
MSASPVARAIGRGAVRSTALLRGCLWTKEAQGPVPVEWLE